MNLKLCVAIMLLASCEKEIIEPAKYYKEITKYSKVADEKSDKKRFKKRKRRYEKINKDANVSSIRISMHSGRRNSRSYVDTFGLSH